jgi:hypothetical protein
MSSDRHEEALQNHRSASSIPKLSAAPGHGEENRQQNALKDFRGFSEMQNSVNSKLSSTQYVGKHISKNIRSNKYIC